MAPVSAPQARAKKDGMIFRYAVATDDAGYFQSFTVF
jgi:hypothetical protein